MATIVAVKPPGTTDDDEAWLYGDSENGEKNEPVAPGTEPDVQLPPPKEDSEMNEEKQQEAPPKDDNEDEDSDDDEDDVQVTIGDIKAFPVASAGGNLFKGSGTYQKQPVIAGAGLKGVIPTITKGVDVEGEGMVNGIPLYEFSLDSLRDEDKPWRKPGADITDYFNYGFNEETWRKYCQKQTRLRQDNGAPMSRFGASGMLIPKLEPSDNLSSGMNRMQNPMSRTIQTTPGTIAVLGSTTASRRPAEESMDDVQLIGALGDISKSQMSIPPPGLPSMGIPPPNYSMPPPGMPPMAAFSTAVPPPGMPVPPPSMYAHPPPVPSFYPQHMPPPGPDARSFAERPPYGYDQSPAISNYSESQSSYTRSEGLRERERYEYKREKSPGQGYNSDASDDYRYSRTKEYTKDFDRDYYRSHDRSPRSRDRSKSRSRDRSRSRERERRHRERDRDEKKSKRKIKDEPDDSDYYKSSSASSKHKKSKRSKRDKDDDSSDKGATERDET